MKDKPPVDKSKWFLTQTVPGTLFHVFKEDWRSLCGKAMMLVVAEEACEPFKGTEKYNKGQDCKACFLKAGLEVK